MMTEHKFTDEEVIEGLKRLSQGKSCDACKITAVPYPTCKSVCKTFITKSALDLITRQKAEIERLDTIVNPKEHGESFFMMINEAKEKTEAYIRQLKAEAIKEFADRLKTYYRNLDRTSGGLVEYHIDQIVKEMLEGEQQ